MARWMEPTAEQEASWNEWVAERPDVVRKIAERLNPWELYRLKTTGQRITLYSVSEDGTVTVDCRCPKPKCNPPSCVVYWFFD
jgi:hypothetical protein